MKKNFIQLFMFAATMLTATVLTACCEEENVVEKPVQQGTVFSTIDESTRTTIDENLNFYWTPGDELWVDDPNTAGAYVKSKSSNIPATGRQPSASFYFTEGFPGDEYQVYYTGQGSSSTASGLKVTIAANQTQAAPNDGSHIATDGDCGTALATKQDGSFHFSLKHKAAYLQIYPYLDASMPDHVILKQIEITSDQHLAGTYSFTKANGLAYASDGTNKITLTCGTYPDFFPIRKNYGMDINGCYVVIAPNTHTLTVKYTLVNTLNGVEAEFTKNVSSRNYAENSVTPLRHKLLGSLLAPPFTYFSRQAYYQWDATNWYWDGVANYPTTHLGYNANYAKNNSNPSWYHEGVWGAITATNSCAGMPTFWAMKWYLTAGGYYDANQEWTIDGRPFKSGIWLKKWDKITKTGAAIGTTPTTCNYYPDGNPVNLSLTQGRPADSEIDDWFFLPALGYYIEGVYVFPQQIGQLGGGGYWTSTPGEHYQQAWSLGFTTGVANLNLANRFDSDIAGNGGDRPDGKPWFQ